MARIFGQMASQPADVFTTLSNTPGIKTLATATLDRPTTDITPAFTYSTNRTEYTIDGITAGVEIIVLDDVLRQEDTLLDTRVRRVSLVSVLVGLFGAGNLQDTVDAVKGPLAKIFGNDPVEGVDIVDPVAYRGVIGAGEDNTGAYSLFTSARTLTFKVGQERFIGEAVEPLAGEVGIPEAPADTKQYVRQDGAWVEVEVQSGPQAYYEIIDSDTAATTRLSVRNGTLVLTDPFVETVSEVDLGGTTPDPGNIAKVTLDGTGRYSVGVSGVHNDNGLVTLEYINSPGQFFVINDIDGGVFGGGDRQGFGLVRESIIDRTDLDGQPGVFDGGNSGGWSLSYTWYYTGGYPYLWTSYASTAQTPGGSSLVASGAMGGQTLQRQWWDLASRAGVGKKIRVGIANGSTTQQDGANYTNRLVMQLYVHQEMIDHPDAATLLSSTVRTNGAGWYNAVATNGEYEGLGQFPDGNDKGYRFRWSTFGNTTLNQLPYVTGVSSNDQIAAASGLSYYMVYNANALDKAAANVVVASSTVGPNNRHYSAGTTVDILQFQQPYTFPNGTLADDVYDLKYTYVGPVQAGPLFTTYPLTTAEEVLLAGQGVAPLEKLHQEVCDEIRAAVTGYYLVRDFNTVNTQEVNGKLGPALQAALSGQLINLYDAIQVVTTDDGAPEGTGGVILFPANLKTAINAKLELWMNTLPDN